MHAFERAFETTRALPVLPSFDRRAPEVARQEQPSGSKRIAVIAIKTERVVRFVSIRAQVRNWVTFGNVRRKDEQSNSARFCRVCLQFPFPFLDFPLVRLGSTFFSTPSLRFGRSHFAITCLHFNVFTCLRTPFRPVRLVPCRPPPSSAHHQSLAHTMKPNLFCLRLSPSHVRRRPLACFVSIEFKIGLQVATPDFRCRFPAHPIRNGICRLSSFSAHKSVSIRSKSNFERTNQSKLIESNRIELNEQVANRRL